MRLPSAGYRLTVYLRLVLFAVVAFFPMYSAKADEGRHQVSEEKAQSISAAMESSLHGLPKLYETVSKSIVRVERTGTLSMSGVIVSKEGHIVVGNGFGSDDSSVWGDKDMKVHLSDGRTVTATAAGWSIEWLLAVMKIKEAGPWPAIELGSTKDLKAGDPCLAIGYAPRGDTQYDSLPSARLAFIDRNMATHWLTTTAHSGLFESPAIVGMDGRLLGIDTCHVNNQRYATAIDLFTANREDLFAGKNLDWVRSPPTPDSIYHIGAGDHPELLSMRNTNDVLGKAKPKTQMSDSQLSEVKEIAKRTTVRLVSKERTFNGKDSFRWSGVIVSESGYVMTCGHTMQLPGEEVTVRLSDGRDADGVALGASPITNLGLVKITTPGSWPAASPAGSSRLKPGDPVVVAGYPAMDANRRLTLVRAPSIHAANVRRQPVMMWYRDFDIEYIPIGGGASGGGVFNQGGRYVAVYQGPSGTRSEFAKLEWDNLKRIESIDTAIGLPHPLKNRFLALSNSAAQSVVELLVDSKPVSIGTIVDAEGWILTKASVLDGRVSCRLPDQSVVLAEKQAESQEHDLALLKIATGDFAAAEFSDEEPLAIAQALCAVGPRQMLDPGIVSVETREIPPEPRWKGGGTEDTQGGVKISPSYPPIITGTKLKFDDIIVSINGHATPNVATLAQVLEENLAERCTGDLVLFKVSRKGASMNVLTALPLASAKRSHEIDMDATPRRSGFATVFDTDIALPKRQVGCPVIDVQGHIRGIAIVSRGQDGSRRGPSSVLPSHIVKRVMNRLMAETR